MKKILKNKKVILIFLTVVILLIFLSNYIKTTEIGLDSLFNENKADPKELLFEADNKAGLEKKEEQKIIINNKNKGNKNIKKKAEIEKIALIKDIKDPFQLKQEDNIQDNIVDKAASAEMKILNKHQDNLVLLERNITAAEMITQSQNSINNLSNSASEKEMNKKLNSTDANDKQQNTRSPINKNSLDKKRLPFRLLGIIKNRNNSSAVFLYQGQTLLKKEKEKIDFFEIKKINKQNLIITYQNEEKTLHLWKEKNNEN